MKLTVRPMSIEMYNFLSTLAIGENDQVINQGNIVDNSNTFISRMYTPNLRVSNATKNFLANLEAIANKDTNLTLDEDTLTYWLIHSNLRTKDFKVYTIFKSVIADIYSYTYAIDVNRYFGKYINKEDLTRTINNIAYIIDYLSGDNDNSRIVGELAETSAMLGVIKNGLSIAFDTAEDDSNNGKV